MLGLPNNDKDFTHTQVGKIGLVIFDTEAFQRLCNQLHCLHCLTMLKNKHTHTSRQKLKFQNCIQHTILTKWKSELISDNVGTAQQW